MLKQLRERIYNRKVESELKKFDSFYNFYNEIYSIYPIFTGYTKDGGIKVFEPKSVYALKRAIQKLDYKDFVRYIPVSTFKDKLNKVFMYAGFDTKRKAECIELYKNIQKSLNKTYANKDNKLELVKEFLSMHGFNWDGRISSVHCPNPKPAEKFEDLYPEEECAFLYETKGKGGFFLINDRTFSKFKCKNDKFTEIADYEKQWSEFCKQERTM